MENSLENEVSYIKLDDIIPNRFQPREVFDETALNELADSIRAHGVIQPIIVRQVDNKYEIIAGERRYKASALAGLTKIPAIVRNFDDKKSSIVAYIENSQRRNVSPIEEARTADRILKSNNMTQEQLANELGISQSALANRLRLLSLPMEVQEALMKNEISERHARSLLTVKEPMKQIELLNLVRDNKMTVRELEGKIKDMYGNNDSNMQFVNNTLGNDFNSVPNSNQPVNNDNNDFLNFISDFDPSKYEKNNNTSDVSNVESVSVSETNNNDFMSFLNNYNPPMENVVDTPSVVNNNQETNNDFMNFLNNYNPPMDIQETPNVEVVENETVSDTSNDFLNLVNGYDNVNTTPTPSNQPVINEVVPPVTSRFNINRAQQPMYVENDVRYQDTTKPIMYNSVDAIINELSNTINKIKNSKYKVDTDEINFDDVYQITIKIDKRDFL